MTTERIGDTWLTIRQAADLVGANMSPQRMRRRLKHLHAQQPNLGLIRRPGARWFEVSAEALKRALTTDPDLHETELDAIAATQKTLSLRLDDQLRRIRALESWRKRHVQQMHLPGLEPSP